MLGRRFAQNMENKMENQIFQICNALDEMWTPKISINTNVITFHIEYSNNFDGINNDTFDYVIEFSNVVWSEHHGYNIDDLKLPERRELALNEIIKFEKGSMIKKIIDNDKNNSKIIEKEKYVQYCIGFEDGPYFSIVCNKLLIVHESEYEKTIEHFGYKKEYSIFISQKIRDNQQKNSFYVLEKNA